MRKFLCLVFPLLLGFALTVSAEPLSQEQLEAIAVQPSDKWRDTERVVPEMLELFKEESIKFDGQTYKYRLHVPEKLEPGKKYPMILWLAGAGEVGSDNKLQLVHLHHNITMLTGEKKRDFFLLVPQCPSLESWSFDGGGSYRTMSLIPDDIKNDKEKIEAAKKKLLEQTQAAAPPGAVMSVQERKETYKQPKPITRTRTERTGGFLGFGSRTTEVVEVIGFDENDVEEVEMHYFEVSVEAESKGGPLEFSFAMVEQVADNYPVDRDRITVSGLSTGGDGTWRALERRPELFAAAVPLVSWVALRERDIEKSPILKKIPIWAIYSSDDNSIDRARADFDRVAAAGCNVKKTEFGICGHNAWTPAMLQADIFTWLLSRGKKDGEYVQVFDPGVDPDQMKGIVDVATRDTSKPALAPAVAVNPVQTLEVGHAASTHFTPEDVPGYSSTRQAGPAAGTPTDPPHPSVFVRRTQNPATGVQEYEVVHQVPQQGMIPRVGCPLISPGIPAFGDEREQAYVLLAHRYFITAEGLIMISRRGPQARVPAESQKADVEMAKETLERFIGTFDKISPKAQMNLLLELIPIAQSPEALSVLEELLDDFSAAPTPQAPGVFVDERVIPPPTPAGLYGPAEEEEGTVVEVPRAISAERIIEECNRPWAMTSGSLYGMFPADWDKEAEAVPDFIVKSDTDELAKQLARSVGEDAESKDFVAACRSILSLQNKPMSSPWFETSGGRLRSDIQYSLSAKGQMLVRFLRAVKDSGGNSAKGKELSKVAEKTLEKIEMVLER